MKQKLLSNAEIIGILLMGFVALITGGWSVIIIVLLIGALVGVNIEVAPDAWRKAIVPGAVSAAAVVLATIVHNHVLIGLPRQESVPAASTAPLIYVSAITLGTAMAAGVAALRSASNARVRRFGLLGLLLACAVAFPFFEQYAQLFWANAIIVAMIFALQALGLNIVAGYAGMLDLGYVAFFAIGGYTIAFLNSPQFDLKISFWLIIWIAAAAAALFGLILGTPVIPLRGDYLAIVTLGFGEIVPIVFKNLSEIRIVEPITGLIAALTGNPASAFCLVGCGEPFNLTNGTAGINPIGRPEFPGVLFSTGQYIPWYFLILGLLIASVFFISRLRNSRIGRAWVAIREDELAANSMGINLVRSKLIAFMLGAMFSGFAGAFYGSYVSFISPDAFDFSISVIVLCMVILGGTGSISGVLLGAFIIKITDLLLLDKLQTVMGGVLRATVFQGIDNLGMQNFLESLLNASQYKLLLFGIILVTMMQFRPQGLVPSTSERKA